MNKFELNNLIDSYIEDLSISGIVRSFYPNAISKNFNIPLTPVLERLSRLVQDGILELKFEIRCHGRSDIIAIVDDYSQYLDKEHYCEFCGEDVYIDLSNVSPIYYINEDYKDFVKKKKKPNSTKLSTLRTGGLMVTT